MNLLGIAPCFHESYESGPEKYVQTIKLYIKYSSRSTVNAT